MMRPLALHQYFAVVPPALPHRPQVQGAGAGGGFGNKPPGQGQKRKQQGCLFVAASPLCRTLTPKTLTPNLTQMAPKSITLAVRKRVDISP